MSSVSWTVEDHGRAFELASAGYDRLAVRGLAQTARGLVQTVKPQPGDRVLDVATGTGWAAFAAAAAVGDAGSVVGVDIAEGMLAKSREKAGEAGIRNIDFRAADATRLPFEDGSFDVAMGASCIFFMPDMPAALREWTRVVKPGGKIAFSCFGETSFQPAVDMFEALLRSSGAKLPPGPRPFPWQQLKSRDDAAGLIGAVGLRPARLETAQVGYYLSSQEECWDFVLGTGMRGSLELLPEGTLPAFRQSLVERMWSVAVEAGYWMDVSPIYAVCRRA